MRKRIKYKRNDMNWMKRKRRYEWIIIYNWKWKCEMKEEYLGNYEMKGEGYSIWGYKMKDEDYRNWDNGLESEDNDSWNKEMKNESYNIWNNEIKNEDYIIWSNEIKSRELWYFILLKWEYLN